MPPLVPFALLEIRPDASVDVAEAAYKAKVKKVHQTKGAQSC